MGTRVEHTVVAKYRNGLKDVTSVQKEAEREYGFLAADSQLRAWLMTLPMVLRHGLD